MADGFAHTQVHTKLTELSDELKTITVVEELPIEGRIVSADGQPIAGVEVRPVDRQKVAPGKLDDYLRDVKSTGTPWHGEYPNGLLPATLKPARTGADGRFRLEGTPAGHVVRLKLAGDNVQNGSLFVAGRKPRDSEPGEVRLPARSRFPRYLASFTHVSPPHRTVQGIVRDQETGKPVVGVRVNSLSSSETESITDAEGRFKITGCLKQKEYRVRVHVDGRRFFAKFVRLRDRPGVGPIEITIELARGIAAPRGLDAGGASGQASARRTPSVVEAFAKALDADDFDAAAALLTPDCRYEVRGKVLTGPDAIIASYAEATREASRRFDAHSYDSAVAGTVILFSDHLVLGSEQHTFQCRQHLTLDAQDRITQIRHEDLPGRREALDAWIEEVKGG